MRLMRGLVGVVLVTACVAALSGCSRANAGSATEDDFAQFMADTDGVTDTGGFVSNNLPFLGSGDLEVELDATRDEQVLEQAVQRATEFDVPAGVTLYTLGVRVTSPGDGAEGEPRPGILIENLWGTPPGDLAAEPRKPDLEAAEVFNGVDFLVVPAAHLGPGVAGLKGLDIESRRQLVPQRLATAVINPGRHLAGRQAEGHGGEKIKSPGTVLPIVLDGVVKVGGAAGNGVKGFERWHPFAGGKDLDRQLSAAHPGNAFGQPPGAGSHAGEITRPGGDHIQLAYPLGQGRGRKRRGADSGDRQALGRPRQKSTPLHTLRVPDKPLKNIITGRCGGRRHRASGVLGSPKPVSSAVSARHSSAIRASKGWNFAL